MLATAIGTTGCVPGAHEAATVTTAPAAPAPSAPAARLRSGGSRSVTAPERAAVSPRRSVHPVAAPPRVVARALPQILGASVSPSVVRSGTVVHAMVRTTAGVVTVSAYAGGASIPVPRVGPGLFAGSTTIPPLPPFVHGSYSVTFVARDARGASTQSAVGVSVR